jgi:agmatinase
MPLPADLLSAFDPDGPSAYDILFGLPFAAADCAVQIIAVPWEATTSYGRGTRQGPAAVLAASGQVDLCDLDFGEAWRQGIGLLPVDPDFERWGDEAEGDAQAVLESGGQDDEAAGRVNALSDAVNERVYAHAQRVLAAGAIPAVLGGDHSTPYGLIRAITETHPGVGFLHIDAHADLRCAYEGFTHSHASIFYNVHQLPGAGRHVGLGWRDVGRGEREFIDAHPDRVTAYFDFEVQRRLAEGTPLLALVDEIIRHLPEKVHVSFDIDGLDPSLCPHTGTPVPGGLSFFQVQLLLRRLAAQRHIVSFDLNEVAPGPEGDEWDANVGARILYKLAGAALASQPPTSR